MTKFTKMLGALLALLLVALLLVTQPASAKDTSWGRVKAPQARDITWGRTPVKAAKDTSWGKVKAVDARVLMKRGVFNDVTHASDDSGWAGPIHIVCGGQHVYLARGEKSALGSNSQCGAHVARWIVPAGHTYYCKNYLPPYQNSYIYVGSTDVPSYSSWKCYDQKAL